MILAYLLPPLFGALSALGLVFLIAYGLKNQLLSPKELNIATEHLLSKLELQELVHNQIASIPWQEALTPLLYKRLNLVVSLFKEQIPMASMIITPQLTEKLMALATPELLKIIPELKEMLAQKVDRASLKSSLLSHLGRLDKAAIKSIFNPLLKKIYLYAALFGFMVGLLQLALECIFKFIIA